MKSNKRIILSLIISLAFVIANVMSLQKSNLMKSFSNAKSTLAYQNKRMLKGFGKNMTAIFSSLFNDPTRKDVECPCEEKSEEEEEEIDDSEGAEGRVFNIPKKKKNYYEKKKIGEEASAYLFDYLDPVMQNIILEEFDKIYKAAQKIKNDPSYTDPYQLSSILNLPPETPTAELLSKMKALVPTFDAAIWQNSISVAQIHSIITEWGWNYDPSKPDPAKFLVDKYDYNGDGRLNPKEFIIAMIRYNKKIIGTPETCKNCMENIVETKIDPIFMYLDCTGGNLVNAEQIWNTLKKLKRPVVGYDYYKCTLEGGKYRTSAINDFVLKSHKTVEGRLDKEEFRLGILQGYWDRHVTENGIDKTDERNLKKFRWANDGAVDVVCERIKSAMKKDKKGK